MSEKINIDNLGTDIDDSTNTEKIVRERFEKEGLPLSIAVNDEDKYDNIKCWQCGNSYVSKLKISKATTDRATDKTLICYNCGCISTIRLDEGKYKPIKCLICNSRTTKISDYYGYFNGKPFWYKILPTDIDLLNSNYVCWYCMKTCKEEINEIIEEHKRKKAEKQEKIKKKRLDERMNELLKMNREELINEIVRQDEELSHSIDLEDC